MYKIYIKINSQQKAEQVQAKNAFDALRKVQALYPTAYIEAKPL